MIRNNLKGEKSYRFGKTFIQANALKRTLRCKIDSCNKPYWAKGFCKVHYSHDYHLNYRIIEKRTPEQIKEKNLKSNYKLSLKDYKIMLNKQDGKCLFCGVSQKKLKKALVVDHDHKCCPGKTSCGKCVRWLICDGCNHGLGNFRDNIEVLIRAANFLEEWKNKNE